MIERVLGSALSRTAGPPCRAFGTVTFRVYIEARMIPSTRRSCIASMSCRSRSGSPSVSPVKSRWPCSRAASRAPQIKWPANGVVATVSDMKPWFSGAGAEAARDDVGAVAGLSRCSEDPSLDVG